MAYNITAGRQGININDKHVDKNGYLKIDDYELPVAGANKLGGVKVGTNLTIAEDGTLSADDQSYTLPIASDEVLGGVKIGNGITIAEDGTISAAGGGAEVVEIAYDHNATTKLNKTPAEMVALFNNKKIMILKMTVSETHYYIVNNYYQYGTSYFLTGLGYNENQANRIRRACLTISFNSDFTAFSSFNPQEIQQDIPQRPAQATIKYNSGTDTWTSLTEINYQQPYEFMNGTKYCVVEFDDGTANKRYYNFNVIYYQQTSNSPRTYEGVVVLDDTNKFTYTYVNNSWTLTKQTV